MAKTLMRAVVALLVVLGAFAAVPGTEAATRQRTTIGATWSDLTPTYNQLVVVTGQITPWRNSAGDGRRVVVQRYASGAWQNVKGARAADGRYRIEFRPQELRAWRYRVFAPGNTRALAGATPAVRMVVSKQPTTVTSSWSRTSMEYNDVVSVTGAVTPATYKSGLQRLVALLKWNPATRSWSKVAEQRLVNGGYTFSMTAKQVGAQTYTVYTAPLTHAAGGQAPSTTLQVAKDSSPIGISLSAAKVKVNTAVKLTGRVTGGGEGGVRRVALYRNLPGGLFWVATADTDSLGNFSFTVPTWFYINRGLVVRVAETATGAAGQSVNRNLEVTPNYTPLGSSSAWTNLDNKRFRWNPCGGVINYRTNLEGAGTGALSDVKEAFARIARATGLSFRHVGSTTAIPGSSRAWPTDAKIVVAWGYDSQTGWDLSGTTVARGGVISSYYATDAIGAVFESARGGVTVERGVSMSAGFGTGLSRGKMLMHELGHVMGLGHAATTNQIMYKNVDTSGSAVLGAGDINGLRQHGLPFGCVRRNTARGVANGPGLVMK